MLLTTFVSKEIEAFIDTIYDCMLYRLNGNGYIPYIELDMIEYLTDRLEELGIPMSQYLLFECIGKILTHNKLEKLICNIVEIYIPVNFRFERRENLATFVAKRCVHNVTNLDKLEYVVKTYKEWQ